jgi:curved DNA-binding protein CbpA
VPAESPDRAARTRKFQLVNDAYYTLSDPTRRRDYDAQRKLFGRNTTSSTNDPFEEADEEIPAQGGAPGQEPGNAYSWAWDFFTSQAAGGAQNREQTEDAQFSDVFEEMMREEGMAENDNQPTSKFWSLVGGLSGGALGFIVANVPGMVAGAVAGNRLGAVRDARGKSVYAVFQV